MWRKATRNARAAGGTAVRSHRVGPSTAARSTSTRSPSPTPMVRPGTVRLPDPEPRVPLAAVAHSMQVDFRRKLAATYDDITQYVDKCDYLFEHDDVYDKSYRSLARTVTDLNKIATDAQQQEREQLYQSLVDWFSSSSFSVDSATQGILNEHQLIESSQTTRDLLMRMLLALERLRALHITIVDKIRSAGELALQQTGKTDNRRQLLRMVDDSTFVWKTAAAEIVQLLHSERSKGGELVELYADKIRYLMGELEAQSSMIEELRMQIDQPTAAPFKFQDMEMVHDMKAQRAKQDMLSRQTKQAAGGLQKVTGEDFEEEDTRGAAAAVSGLPDFNKQLLTTLQKELEECRRQNNDTIARGHESAAKARFLTEESSRKDKQIAQLQAQVAKLRSEPRDGQRPASQTSSQQLADDGRRRSTKSKGRPVWRRRKSSRMSVELVDDDDDDETRTTRPMNLSRLIAAAKRQKRASPVGSPGPPSVPSSVAAQQLPPPPAASAAAAVSASKSSRVTTGRPTSRAGGAATSAGRAPTNRSSLAAARHPDAAASHYAPTSESTKPAAGKPARSDRGRGKPAAAHQATVAPRPADTSSSVKVTSRAPSIDQLSSFWQTSSIKQWTPGAGDDTPTGSTAHINTAASGDGGQTAPANVVDMNEAIEMTKLYLSAASSSQQQQQSSSAKTRRRTLDRNQQQHQQAGAVVQSTSEIAALTESRPDVMQRHQPTAKIPAVPAVGTIMPAPVRATQPAATTSSKALGWQQRAKTPGEAARQRAARLSVALHHTDDALTTGKPATVPPVTTPFSSGLSPFKPGVQQQQPLSQKSAEQTKTTKAKQRDKPGYNLVGVNVHNLAEQAKSLDDSDTSRQRFLH